MKHDIRQKVTLSEYNSNLLRIYVKQRGMNMSSAISEMVSNSLDAWVKKQKDIGSPIFNKEIDVQPGYEHVLPLVLIKLSEDLLATHIFNKTDILSLSPANLAEDILQAARFVVGTDQVSAQTIMDQYRIAQIFYQSKQVQSWYQHFLSKTAIIGKFNRELAFRGLPEITAGHNLAGFDFEGWDVDNLSAMILSTCITSMRLDTDSLQWLTKEKPDKIIIYGLTGTGKTILQMQLKRLLNLSFCPMEIKTKDIMTQFLENNSVQIATCFGWDLFRYSQELADYRSHPEHGKIVGIHMVRGQKSTVGYL